MRTFLGTHLLLAAASAIAGLSADAPPPTPKGPRMAPLPAQEVIPAPMPGLDAAVTLDAGVEFLIDHDVECVVESFPPDALKIKRRFIPKGEKFILPGKFIDLDKGLKVVEEEREFAGPLFLYRVSANKTGECWLAVVEVGSNKMIKRRIVCNVAPQPPPTPVDPKVDPKPPEPVKSFKVLFVYESGGALPVAAQKVMFGEKVAAFLDAKTTAGPKGEKGWRRYDKDVSATNDPDPSIKALWEAAKPKVTAVPCVVVAVNDKAEIVPLPADEDAAVALFNKYLGVK